MCVRIYCLFSEDKLEKPDVWLTFDVTELEFCRVRSGLSEKTASIRLLDPVDQCVKPPALEQFAQIRFLDALGRLP